MIGELNGHMNPNPNTRPDATAPPSTWRLAWRLIRYQPGLWAVDALFWGLVWSLPVAVGYLVKLAFDALTGSARAGFNLPTLLTRPLWKDETAAVSQSKVHRGMGSGNSTVLPVLTCSRTTAGGSDFFRW